MKSGLKSTNRKMPIHRQPLQELVYCIADAQFYYPERSLTDEELLQLIDLEHKNLYIYERIQREIERGERAGWPETYDIQR